MEEKIEKKLHLSTLSKTLIIFLIIVIGSTIIKVLRDLKVNGAGLLNIPMVVAIFYVGNRPNIKQKDWQNDNDDQKQSNPEPTVGVGGFTELMFAAGEGDLDSCKRLIDQGLNVNQQDEKGATALIYAVLNSNTEIARLLLGNNADPNITTKKGTTAKSVAKNKKIEGLF